jgi:predicted dithiol-disulfide oxidoreductase (DUF899 family)
METCNPNKPLTEEIIKLEQEIDAKRKEITALRKQIAAIPVSDYTFTNVDGTEVRLSDLFGSGNELMLVHNMGKRCPYCTLWADEYNGVVDHLNNRVPFVVVSPDEHDVMNEFAMGRNWNFKIISSKGNTFKKDVGFEEDNGMVMPGVSVFTKDADGKMYHYSAAYFGPGDSFSAIWHYFDLLPDGAGKWAPKFKY